MATKKQEWRKALLKTADKIEELGWCQGQFENHRTGAVCSIGGLNKVLRATDPLRIEVIHKFDSYLVASERVPKSYRGGAVITYNDAKGRKKKQVLEAMRDCACNFECPDADRKK